jgi:predicted ribosome quality control (RQC) complex YloA/Tae2 family protein
LCLSASEIAVVVDDLRARVVPAVVRRVTSPPEDGLLFELRARRATHRLLVSFEPTATRLHLVAERVGRPGGAVGFARTLHAALEGAVLADVRRLGDDRAVLLDFGRRSVALELTGRHANAFLLDEGGIIRSSFRPSASRKRSLLWGNPYRPPIPRTDAEWLRAPSRFPAGEAVHEAIAESYAARAAEAVEVAARRVVLGRLRAEARRLEKLATNLRRELAEASEAEAWRRRGELLKGVPADLPRRRGSVRVVDWFDPATPEIDVPLDPAVGIRENRERCFARARKLARRPAAIGPRLETCQRELRAALADLDVLETAAWDDPRAAAVLERWRPPAAEGAKAPRGSRRAPAVHVPYRAFRSADGHEILVGKSARDNDRLTFQVARGFDAWLHAAGAAGSHVVVRVPKGREVTEAALRDAALLALHYSKLARRGEGEVHAARRCDVRRVRGGAPGQVTVTHERRIWVRIDPARLGELLASSVCRS